MLEKTLKRNIKSAGCWFEGENNVLILNIFDQLESDKHFKSEFVKKLFNVDGRDKIKIW